MSNCPPDKILNPATGRCVKKDGKVGRALLSQYNVNLFKTQGLTSTLVSEVKMTASELVIEAISALYTPGDKRRKDRFVSRTAIKNYIGERSTRSQNKINSLTVTRINQAIKNLVSKGMIIQIRDSFTLTN